MRRRLSPLGVALAVVLQLLLAGAPSSALVLCVSDDGCTAVEVTMPGSGHCIERGCDDEHRETADDAHGCRDFAFVTAAPAKAQSAAPLLPVLAGSWAAPLALIATNRQPAGAGRAGVVPPAARSLRSTVLLL